MSILVTGGAGYIGSHIVKALLEKEREVVVYDNLSTGHREVPQRLNVPLVEGDIHDKGHLLETFDKYKVDSIIHFAASSLVAESCVEPYKYYNNNLYGTLCLLDAMKVGGVKHIVFSSTAAVYGEPVRIPIEETDPTNPTNPYGNTKLSMEQMMHWFDDAHGMKYVSLRYFNAAGADKSGLIGEAHNPETHLIPIVLQAAAGKREQVSIFGEDYETGDGSCIRDYIHVCDLAQAHILALDYLQDGGKSDIFNLGSGQGFTVKEIIQAAKKVTKQPIKVVSAPRRSGDPAVLIASSEKIKNRLGWNPKYDSVEEIIEDAWNFIQKNRDGYAEK